MRVTGDRQKSISVRLVIGRLLSTCTGLKICGMRPIG